jgi:hypothetical protein
VEPIREQLERLRARAAALGAAHLQLAAARNRTQVRRRAVDAGGPVAVALFLLTAFGLANAAAVISLATAMPTWAAALALAGAWIVVAALTALALKLRADRGVGWPWWRPLTAGPADAIERLEAERARAEQEVRETVAELAPRLSEAAVAAALPVAMSVAGAMAAEAAAVAADVAGDAVDAGSDLIEASDEIVESITVEMPGGRLVNQVWDVVLTPGRWGVKVVTTVLRRPPPD